MKPEAFPVNLFREKNWKGIQSTDSASSLDDKII